MFAKKDITRNACQLFGAQAWCGYDWWWHSFTARDAETGEEKSFFIEFFLCNPKRGKKEPVFGQLPENHECRRKPTLGATAQRPGRGKLPFGKHSLCREEWKLPTDTFLCKENPKQSAGKCGHRVTKPSYLMVKAGTWGGDARQMHRFFGWKEVRVSQNVPFRIKAGDCYLTENKMNGYVAVSEEEAKRHPEWMCDAGRMEFRLKMKKLVPFNVGYGAGKPFRKMQLFEMFWHAEGMKTAYSGEVIYNGRRYVVTPETCYGYADKNWGRDFTSPWVWLSSNDLVSEVTGKRLNNSVFDIGGGCPKVGPVALPRQLLSAFWYEGQEYEFNFSKFWTGTSTKFNCRETDTRIIWHVEQSSRRARMVTDITCEKKDMLLVNYEAPNGLKKHNRLWNGGNGQGTIRLYKNGKLIDRIHAGHVGCEYGEYCRPMGCEDYSSGLMESKSKGYCDRIRF